MFFKNDPVMLLQSYMVYGNGYTLDSEYKDSYQYPIDGWYWFDTEEEAREFFGMPPKEDIILEPGVL